MLVVIIVDVEGSAATGTGAAAAAAGEAAVVGFFLDTITTSRLPSFTPDAASVCSFFNILPVWINFCSSGSPSLCSVSSCFFRSST